LAIDQASRLSFGNKKAEMSPSSGPPPLENTITNMRWALVIGGENSIIGSSSRRLRSLMSLLDELPMMEFSPPIAKAYLIFVIVFSSGGGPGEGLISTFLFPRGNLEALVQWPSSRHKHP
jgi:hypothetical protein